MCVFGKELPFAGYSVVKESAVALARVMACRNGRDIELPADARQSLVENTGLEPVTSWLQTRRSPS